MGRVNRLAVVRGRLWVKRLGLCLLAFAAAGFGQDPQFRQTGACGRCHVSSVVEWSISKHARTGTDCVACHGASNGHVSDERNNVKPERIPRGAAVSGLCVTCHASGCPRSKKTTGCPDCHHVHALVDPSKPAIAADPRIDRIAAAWREADSRIAEGERLMKATQWRKAGAEFRAALASRPGDRRAANDLKICERRLNPTLTGFDIVGTDIDAGTGLPRHVRAAGAGIEMILVPGGERDIGSDRFPVSKPVHTVRVDDFYLGRFEVTRAEWSALMGTPLSGDSRQPAGGISWEDAQAFVRKLNEHVPGGGFRLPTEAEWEFAARAAGSGLENMLGGVWEWCSSLYAPYPYQPADGRENPAAPGLRVLRGGGFADTPDLLDPAMRHGERPPQRIRWNGVRIARGVPL